MEHAKTIIQATTVGGYAVEEAERLALYLKGTFSLCGTHSSMSQADMAQQRGEIAAAAKAAAEELEAMGVGHV